MGFSVPGHRSGYGVLPRHMEGSIGVLLASMCFAHTWMENLPHAGANTHPDAHRDAPSMCPGKIPSMCPGKAPSMCPGKPPSMCPGKTPFMCPGKTPSMPRQNPIHVPRQNPIHVPKQNPIHVPRQNPIGYPCACHPCARAKPHLCARTKPHPGQEPILILPGQLPGQNIEVTPMSHPLHAHFLVSPHPLSLLPWHLPGHMPGQMPGQKPGHFSRFLTGIPFHNYVLHIILSIT